MEGLQLAFMAPPPPLTRSPSPALAGEAGGTLRPLAGFWFLNEQSRHENNHPRSGFPSPCGVLVLKSDYPDVVKRAIEQFPSPCGVLVLKSLNALRLDAHTPRVSVPLRGSGS